MGKEASRNVQKNELLAEVQTILSERLNSDVLRVGPSEIALPGVDAEGNEFFYLVKISIPRGTRNGSGGYNEYNGYAEASAYKQDQETKAADRAAAAAKKADSEAQKARKREAQHVKKAIQNLEKAVKAE